ncbi:MAG: DUF4446 family protein [Schwartzia sp.]|nr:DUF4446 family protein [Schwartzia sp. (in: firmicutes)]
MQTGLIGQIAADPAPYVYGAAGLLALLTLLVLYLLVSLSGLKSRYRQMMTGDQTGKDFEKMMLEHIAETRAVAEENARLKQDIVRIDLLLQRAVTRIGVVRFNAFKDTGSDLSYAVALLDSNNDGVVFSSIFGREDSRSYVKPIEDGKSTYTLTLEEQQALKSASQRV